MNVHHLELFYFVAKHGGIAAAAWNRPNLRTKGISAPGEGRHRAAQCHSKCLSRERSYDRLRNIDAKAADRAKKHHSRPQCGMWPRRSVSLAFAPRLGSGSRTNPRTTSIFGATTE